VTTAVDNGVNVEALLGAREALSGAASLRGETAPEAAKFKWRATCKWMNGTHSQPSVKGFFGLGAEQSHKTEFTFDADHPEVFAAEDNGRDAGRVRARRSRQLPDRRRRGGRAEPQHPAALGQATLEGGMDIQGILGIDSDVRNGFDGIKVPSTSTPTPRRRRSRRWSRSRRSARRCSTSSPTRPTSPSRSTEPRPTSEAAQEAQVDEQQDPVVVIGAGHAGLAMSRCLTELGIDHVVLERGEVANSWRPSAGTRCGC
jgi:hypothetical protein